MQRRIGTAVLGFLATFATPLFVTAGTENLPGSMCVGTNAALTITANGNADNATASTVTAICPTERVMISGALATNFSARVWVNDRNGSADVCCRVVSRQPNGNEVLGDSVCSTGNSTTDQSLSLPGITDRYTFSSFFVRCTMPPTSTGNSRILTYRATES
jgi:hypothetical protein